MLIGKKRFTGAGLVCSVPVNFTHNEAAIAKNFVQKASLRQLTCT